MSTAQLTDQQKHADAVHKRLMGKFPTPMPLRIIPPPTPIQVDLEDIQEPPYPKRPAILLNDDMIWREGVAEILVKYEVGITRLIGRAKDNYIVGCRLTVAKYLRDLGWSNTRIGRFLHRDHASIHSLLNPGYRRKAARLAAREAKSK